MAQGIGSHGTLIAMQPGGTGAFTEIAEIGDIQMPGFMRNDFDITSQGRNIDTYVMGVLRREPVTFPMFFNAAIASQVLLRTAMFDSNNATNMINGFRITTPDSDVLIFSGGVKELKRTQPVDGVQTANVVIRPTGGFMLNGVNYS